VLALAVNATAASASDHRLPPSPQAPMASLDSGPADRRRLPVVS
jgi:hypothetical protein